MINNVESFYGIVDLHGYQTVAGDMMIYKIGDVTFLHVHIPDIMDQDKNIKGKDINYNINIVYSIRVVTKEEMIQYCQDNVYDLYRSDLSKRDDFLDF
jgi:hypothetical protein